MKKCVPAHRQTSSQFVPSGCPKLLPREPIEKVPTTKFFTRLRDLEDLGSEPSWVSRNIWGKTMENSLKSTDESSLSLFKSTMTGGMH